MDDLTDAVAELIIESTLPPGDICRWVLWKLAGQKDEEDNARHDEERRDNQSHFTREHPPYVVARDGQPEPSVHLTLA